MGSLRAQIAWLVRGAGPTRAALDEHAAAIRQLQTQVEALTRTVGELGEQVDRIAPQVEQLPVATRAAVDDLGDRIGAVSSRLDALEAD